MAECQACIIRSEELERINERYDKLLNIYLSERNVEVEEHTLESEKEEILYRGKNWRAQQVRLANLSRRNIKEEEIENAG